MLLIHGHRLQPVCKCGGVGIREPVSSVTGYLQKLSEKGKKPTQAIFIIVSIVKEDKRQRSGHPKRDTGQILP